MMNKKIFVALLLCVATGLSAEQISEHQAAIVAQNFLQGQVSSLQLPSRMPGLNMPARKGLHRAPNQHQSEYYVFNIGEDNGYVIVSADDCAYPILAYIEQGSYDEQYLPANAKAWLQGYAGQIAQGRAWQLSPDSTISAEWARLSSGVAHIAHATVLAGPLLTSKWNQDAPFNNQCPYDNSYRERTPTGCVATAMAQVMNYWGYPEKGTGYHSYNHSQYGTLSASFGATTYDWANMKNDYQLSTTTAQKQAVATLMYHCGVATEMSYDVSSNGGSGTFIIPDYCETGTDNAAYALRTYFGYQYTQTGIRDYNISTSQWKQLLKNDLKSGKPVIYAGFGEGGHCFVCDGYDSADYYHFNWGWGGVADGYFKLDALNLGSTQGIGGGNYQYNNSQMAIFGLQPDSQSVPSPQGTYDLRLYSNITAEDTIRYFDDLNMSVKVANYGGADFTGTFAVVLFDEDGSFYAFVDSISGTLETNTYFTYSSTYTGQSSFTPGTYYIAYFYRNAAHGWTIVDDGNYTNIHKVVVEYYDGIEVYSDMSPTTELVQGESATLSIKMANVTNFTFYGSFRLCLSDVYTGHVEQVIAISQEEGLESGYYKEHSFTNDIAVEPGTYLLEMSYQEQGTSAWYYAGSSYQKNPIRVVVKAADIQPDQYESNNDENNAYTVNYNNQKTNGTIRFTGANIHVGSDVDYYRVYLPTGKKYSIVPTYVDSRSSSQYSLVGTAVYYTSQNSIHNTITSKTQSVIVEGGEYFYIKVCPMFSGGKGTYQIDLQISQYSSTDLDEVEHRKDDIRYIDPLGRDMGGKTDAKKVKIIYLK